LYHRILDIGPEFKVTSEIDAQLKLTDIQASVDLKYDLNDISFVFPPQQGSSQAGTFKPGTTSESPAPISLISMPYPTDDQPKSTIQTTD